MADEELLLDLPTDIPPEPLNTDGIAPLPQGDAPVLSPTTQQTFGNAMVYGIPSIGVGLLDTIGQSLGVLGEETVPNAMRNFTGQGENSFGDFYARNRAAARAGGEIAGMFLPGLAAMKVLKTLRGATEMGKLGSTLKNSSAMRTLFGNSAELTAAESSLAAKIGDAAAHQGVWAGRAINTPAVTAAKRSFYAKRAVDSARTTAAFELGTYSAFNSSDIFYPPDAAFSDQIKWAGAGAAAGVALDLVAAKFAVRNIVQSVVKSTQSGAAAEVLAVSPFQKVADQTIFRPNKRGVGLTTYASMNDDLTQLIKLNENSAQLKTNLTQDQVNIKKIVSEQVGLMGYDTHPVLPRTNLSASQKELAFKALEKNPSALLPAVKIADLPDDPSAFYSDMAKFYEKAKSEYNTSAFRASQLGDKTLELEEIKKANEKLIPIERAVNEIHYVLEPDGRTTIFKERAPNWLDTNSFDSIKRKTYITPTTDTKGIKVNMGNSKLMAKGDNDLTLHDNFRIEMPKSASQKDYSALYAMGSKMIRDWKPVEHQQFILTPQVNWRTLEMTSALAKAKPQARDQIQFGGNSKPAAGYTRVYRGGHQDDSMQATFDVARSDKYAEQYGELHYADIPDSWIESKGYAADLPNGIAGASTFKIPRGLAKFNKVNKQEGFSSLDDVDFHVLNSKFKEFLEMMPSVERAPIASVKKGSLLNRIAGSKTNLTPAQVYQRLNLPEPIGLNTSPVVEMFAHAKLQGMKDLNEMFPMPKGLDSLTDTPYHQMDLVRQHLRETAGILDPKINVPISGTLLQQVDDTRPLFVAATSVPPIARADAEVIGRVQAMRDIQLERLAQISVEQSPLVSSVLGKIVSQGGMTDQQAIQVFATTGRVNTGQAGELSGAATRARMVQTLQDGVLSGTGQLVYQDRINEQFPALKAMQLVAQDTDKMVDNYVATLAAQNLTPRYASILAPKNKADLFDFNRIEQSYRHGWEIEKITVSPSQTGYSFQLKQDSRINAELMRQYFPEEEGIPSLMPDMSVTARKNGYLPLQVSKPAGDLAQAISDMSIQSGKENNALRVALGKNAIRIREFHLPTPELNRQGTWFVRNPQGKVIATYTGDNFAENQRRAQKAAETLGDSHVAVPLETVRRDHQINDDNFFSIIDYSDQLAKTGAGIKGGLAHTEIDTGSATIKSMVRSLQEQYLNVGIRARAAVFEPELNYARQAADTASAATRTNAGSMNIFDRYIATAFSQNPTNSNGIIGKWYTGIEDSLDRSLSFLSSKYTELSGNPESVKNSKITQQILRQRTSEAEYKAMEKHLQFTPFDDANAWMESTYREKPSQLSRQYAGLLSKISSTLSLRLLDVGTALQNFTGLMTNAPSVMYALRKGSNETIEQWIDRTAAWGTQISSDTVTFSPMKAMKTAINAIYRGELNDVMMDAAKHGYFDPEYASLTRALATPQRPTAKAIEDWSNKMSYMADKSEIIARQISWAMGYKVGKDLHKFTDEKNAYIFANNFVNDMIGNYSPNNRPAMFQGTVGQPLGAFQTYMFNFYRRLYGMIERGDKAALAAQYAAQASIFGFRSIPGYNAWNQIFQSTNDGGDDFTTRVNSTFAPGVGELLLNGSISNIPKIWGGLQGDGLAFYSRGSVDITQRPATALEMSKAPPIQFLTETYKGIRATIDNITGAGGFSIQQQEEILARFSTNRAMKSIMEMAADVKTSDRGTVIDKGTRDAFNVAAALLGTQPSSVRSAQDASRRQRAVELSQQDKRATLLDHTRALMRGDELTVENLQEIVQDYLNAGGRPEYLGQWFRNAFMSANTPEVEKKIQQLYKSGKMDEFENMLATLQQNQAPEQQK